MAKQIVIIGGGASGLTAAIFAARAGASVTLLERNERPGRKLLATGNGRCNLTNLNQSRLCYRGEDPDRAFQIISRFNVQRTIGFFSDLGLYTRNREGWIYPYTGQASSVLQLLLMEAAARKVKIKTRETVKEIRRQGDGSFLTLTEGWQYPSQAVIIACGSPASAVEGASGTAESLAKSLGHRFLPFRPALVPLLCRGGWFSKWAGIRALGIASLYVEEERFDSETGELQLTDSGISGIPVFQLSRYAAEALSRGQKTEMYLDFLPDYSWEALTEYLSVRKKQCPYKSGRDLLIGLIPERLIPVLLPRDMDFRQMAGSIKAFPVEIKGTASLKQAQVCSGGVPLRELTENLESCLVKGVYFTGEAADVDGACGGYNLQWAWSSGAAAGAHAAGGTL